MTTESPVHTTADSQPEGGKLGAAIAVAFCAIPLLAALGGIAYSIPDTPRAQRAAAEKLAKEAAQAKAAQAGLQPAAYSVPAATAIPDTKMGEWIQRGEAIFLRTPDNAKGFSGNPLSCANCHLDAGRLKNAAPMWGAYPLYPAYRKKTDHVDTFAERVRGCFMYSMNGKAPDDGHDILVAVEAYAYWMAQKAPIGEKLPGAGFKKVPKAEVTPTFEAGQKVYEAKCALCHGDNGQGQKKDGVTVFPPLWGKESYNWGAGMHEIDKAASFIKANMPYGLHNDLSDQEAWEVATFINSFERPQDPRFNGSIAKTREIFHDSPNSMYGLEVNGKLLGKGI
ncbi:c-type cytochrome [Comamonas sp. GB3 AK4-5]|uniref:c-type cytochrome n=1 Tax=Comamonas sp. GB3 AK4-5 TaxID=3231487 RepID=UPI00351DAA04